MIFNITPKDQTELEQFLSQYPETSMFMRGNIRAAGLTYSGQTFEGEYLGYKTNRFQGVLVHYWNGNIMMQATDINVLDQLCEHYIKHQSRPIAGILGDEHQACYVIEKFALQKSDFAINYSEKLYQLDLSKMCKPQFASNAKLILAGSCDKNILRSWFEGYHIEALGADPNEANFQDQIDQAMFETNQFKSRWVLLVNDEPVSLCGFNSELPEMVQLGPVWTPPEFRSKGYARQLVTLCLQDALNKGVKSALLFTNNPPAIRAYESVGFKHIGAYRLALCKLPLHVSKSASNNAIS